MVVEPELDEVELGGLPKQPDNTMEEATALPTRAKKRRRFFMEGEDMVQ